MRTMLSVWRTALLVAVVVLSLTLVEARQKDWYETTTIYQIYTRSFKDTDGDGIGDLKGIFEKLDYIQSIGYETLWIQGILKSPQRDLGYDITDFKAIDPLYGTMEEFKELVKTIHDKGMKVMLDFVPNHTSNESEWFQKSVDRVAPYTDYFMWRDPKGYNPKTKQPVPPNNWLSVFGGSIWEWHEKRKQFYLHQFIPAQPDLDYRNPAVREAMKDVLRFWLDLGVDGFRIDAIVHLVEDEFLRDNPWRSPDMAGSTQYYAQIHTYSQDRDETYEVTHEWRMLLEEYKARDGHTRVIAVETYQTQDEMRRFFGNETYKNVHFPLNCMMPGLEFGTNAITLNMTVREWVDNMPSHGVPSWQMSNHDLPRMTFRTFPQLSESAFMIQLLLPGVGLVYYGEEIGVTQSWVRPDQVRDPSVKPNRGFVWYTRDWARLPMQWDDSINAGFTTKKEPWLPVNPDYWSNNVKRQLEDQKSHLKTFKRLMKLRKSPVIKEGQLETCVPSPWLFVFRRSLDDQPPVLVVVNLGSETESVCLDSQCPMSLPDAMSVYSTSVHSGYNTGDKFSIANVSSLECSTLRPKAGVVLLPLNSNPETNAAVSFSHPCFILLLSLVVTTYLQYQQ